MPIDTAISVIVNGEEITLGGGASVTDLLRAHGRDPEQHGIAVAVNGAVVPRSEWAETALSDGDEVELITAFQGG